MKIECHILSVEDVGDKLRVKMQGCGISEADGARCAPQELEIPADQRSRKAFYVGRKVILDVRPQ
jgi:hypothetical protein